LDPFSGCCSILLAAAHQQCIGNDDVYLNKHIGDKKGKGEPSYRSGFSDIIHDDSNSNNDSIYNDDNNDNKDDNKDFNDNITKDNNKNNANIDNNYYNNEYSNKNELNNFLMGIDAGISENQFKDIYLNFQTMGLNSSIKNLKLYNKFAEDILEVFIYILMHTPVNNVCFYKGVCMYT
jgi:hypothetical protein